MKEIGTVDGGKVFTGKKNTYLVIYLIDGTPSPHIETGSQICDRMDMADCYDIHIVNLQLINGTELIACRFYGTWHDPSEPLKMRITNRYTDEEYDVFYGTDH